MASTSYFSVSISSRTSWCRWNAQSLQLVGNSNIFRQISNFSGIGFTLIVDQNDYQVVKEYLDNIHEPHHVIGEIVKRKPGGIFFKSIKIHQIRISFQIQIFDLSITQNAYSSHNFLLEIIWSVSERSRWVFHIYISIIQNLILQLIKVAILISGTGSNMVKLIEYSKRRASHYEVSFVRIVNLPFCLGSSCDFQQT